MVRHGLRHQPRPFFRAEATEIEDDLVQRVQTQRLPRFGPGQGRPHAVGIDGVGNHPRRRVGNPARGARTDRGPAIDPGCPGAGADTGPFAIAVTDPEDLGTPPRRRQDLPQLGAGGPAHEHVHRAGERLLRLDPHAERARQRPGMRVDLGHGIAHRLHAAQPWQERLMPAFGSPDIQVHRSEEADAQPAVRTRPGRRRRGAGECGAAVGLPPAARR